MIEVYEADLLSAINGEIARLGSQRKVAKAMGISVQYLSDILRKRRNIGKAAASYFGCDVKVIRIYTRKYIRKEK